MFEVVRLSEETQEAVGQRMREFEDFYERPGTCI